MDPQPVEFHPQAVVEAREARAWYAEIRSDLADAFVEELDNAIAQIAESPDRWPKYLHGTRQILLKQFPYVVVYRTTTDVIQVAAVAHARRKPGYWKERLTE